MKYYKQIKESFNTLINLGFVVLFVLSASRYILYDIDISNIIAIAFIVGFLNMKR